MAMRLCGLNIPFEYQYAEKTAANRIHNMAEEIREPDAVLSYDNLDIAGALRSRAKDAQGICDALKKGVCVDAEGKPIAPRVVKQELETLSDDLQTIVAIVKRTLASDKGKERWPQLIPKNACTESISIPSQLEALQQMSKNFQELSLKVSEE